jgi:hypothetical protein
MLHNTAVLGSTQAIMVRVLVALVTSLNPINHW